MIAKRCDRLEKSFFSVIKLQFMQFATLTLRANSSFQGYIGTLSVVKVILKEFLNTV